MEEHGNIPHRKVAQYGEGVWYMGGVNNTKFLFNLETMFLSHLCVVLTSMDYAFLMLLGKMDIPPPIP